MTLIYIRIKRSADARVYDVLILSEDIAQGSVNRALHRKMYNKGVRMYSLMYETIVKKVFDSIQLVVEKNCLQTNLNIKNLNFGSGWENEILKSQHNVFLNTEARIQSGPPLQQFCMSFLKILEFLLNTIYSIRFGDWELLSSVLDVYCLIVSPVAILPMPLNGL